MPDDIFPFAGRVNQSIKLFSCFLARFIERLVALPLHEPQHLVWVFFSTINFCPIAPGLARYFAQVFRSFFRSFKIMNFHSHGNQNRHSYLLSVNNDSSKVLFSLEEKELNNTLSTAKRTERPFLLRCR